MYAAESRGDLPAGTAEKWEAHTPKGKKLPKHVKKAKPYPFLIDIKLANLGVTNVGPASNALAGFGQAMLGSAPVSIPRQTNFVPTPSPQTPPILGGPTAGPGTPTSGGAMPKAPTLGDLQGMDRATNTGPASTSSSTSTIKTADIGSVFRTVTNAAQKAVPAVRKAIPAAPKLTPVAPKVAPVTPQVPPVGKQPWGVDGAGRYHMDEGGRMLNPHTGRPVSIPDQPINSSIPAMPGSTPPTAKVVSPPPAPSTPAPAVKAPPPPPAAPPAAAAPAPSAPSPYPLTPPPAPPAPPAAGPKGNFWTNPLNGSAPPAAGVGPVKGTLNAATRLVTPHTTLAEAGTALEKGLTGRTSDPMRWTPGRTWGDWAKQEFVQPFQSVPGRSWKDWRSQNLTGAGVANAGLQLATVPGRAGEATLRAMAGGSHLGRFMGGTLGMAAGTGYAAIAGLQNRDQPMADTGLISSAVRPFGTLSHTLGLNPNTPAAGYDSVFKPFGVGYGAVKSLAEHPGDYAELAGKSIYNKGRDTVTNITNQGRTGVDMPSMVERDQHGRIIDPGKSDTTGNIRNIMGDKALLPDQAAIKQMPPQQVQQIKDQGTAIAQQAQQDPNMQMQGMENLQKEMPEGTPPSFISSLWKIIQANPWASGLMIAGLGVGALSMLGAFGNNNGIAAIAGLASTMVGAGLMPKELWTQISAKLFGGQQAPAPAAVGQGAAVAGGQGAVANPKLAPGQAAAQPTQQADAYGLTPADKTTMMSNPAIRPFLGPDGSPNPTAIKNFVMNGDVNSVPGIVEAIPPHARPRLAEELRRQGAGWTSVGKAFIQSLNGA